MPGLSKILQVICVLVTLTHAVDGRAAALAEGPDASRVTVGAFINNIPHVDLQANEVSIDAYIWFRWDPTQWPPREFSDGGAAERGAVLPKDAATAGAAISAPSVPTSADTDEGKLPGPAGTFEVIGAGEAAKTLVYSRPEEGYCCIQWKGKRSNHWDVRDYPFDQQEIRLTIEDSTFDSRQLRYEPDIANCGMSPEIHISGCKVDGLQGRVDGFMYPTNFGDPKFTADTQSTYSRFTLVLRLHRDGWGMFFKLFTALLTSTFVAILAFFINPTQVDPRFGLCVGGLFGIVASSYAVSTMLPETAEVCYADRLHQIGLLAVLATVIESAYSLSLHLNHGERGAAIAKRLDRVSACIVAGLFISAVIWMTLRVASGNHVM